MNYYGLSIAWGVLLAYLFVKRALFEKSKPQVLFFDWEDSFIWVFIGAIFGARLYHIIDYWDFYYLAPLKILALWNGGLGIWGGILGGFFGLYIYLLVKGRTSLERFISYSNIYALGAPLAQAIGRLGNFFNQELFGCPTNLPWGIFIDQKLRPDVFKSVGSFHPLFLYELLLDLLLFIFLFYIFKKSNGAGAFSEETGSPPVLLKNAGGARRGRPKKNPPILLMYMSGYAIIRILLEPLRINPWVLNLKLPYPLYREFCGGAEGVSVSVLVSITILLILLLLAAFRVFFRAHD